MTLVVPPCVCGHRRYRHYLRHVTGGVAHPCGEPGCGCSTYQAAGGAR